MTFTMRLRPTADRHLELDLTGEMLGNAPARLQSRIASLIAEDHPERLVVDLAELTALSSDGIHALLSGYSTAVGHGVHYQVRHAHGEVRRVLQLADVHDVLADSNDHGALAAAVRRLDKPVPPPRTCWGWDGDPAGPASRAGGV
ncbi:STAS domain-containing protein [Amycolatopsis sp. NPDC098790]|uniref:STAS domain-containing protein n=1 Tax=Amycolatopsis sp. NPDC098790 TaxID=3363939 RepID=UPI003807BF32